MRKRPGLTGTESTVFAIFLLPLYIPALLIAAVALGYKEAEEVAVSTRKGTLKRISRARRRRRNRKNATNDVAQRETEPIGAEQNRMRSHLLKLPLELRQQIYDLHFLPLTFTLHELDLDGYKLIGRTHWTYHGPKALPKCDPVNCPWATYRVLGLPLTCRQLYRETIDYVYRKHTFRFEDADLALLLPSLSVFPQRHLDTLRSLELKFHVELLFHKFKLPFPPSVLYQERTIDSPTAKLVGIARQRRKWTELWASLEAFPRLEKLSVLFTRFPMSGYVPAQNMQAAWILEPILRFERPHRLASFEVDWPGDLKLLLEEINWEEPVPFLITKR